MVGVIAVVGTLLVSTPASAHRSGCHRWHSCPSDTGSYTCGDLGYSTYCGGTLTAGPGESSTATTTERLLSNPSPKWDGYANWPFTSTVGRDDPILSLINFSHRAYKPVTSATTDSDTTRSLAMQLPKTTILTPNLTAYEFASNSPAHFTRILELKNSYSTHRRITGRFVNGTGGTISFGKVSVFQNIGNGQSPRKVTTSYLTPSTLLTGQEAYYDITVYSVDSVNDLAVGVTDWLESVTLPQVHRFPVSDVKWLVEDQYLPSLEITATILNDTTQSASFIDVLFILKDKSGLPLQVQRGYLFAVGAGKSAQASINIFSDFEGLATIEVLAYMD